MKPLMLLVFYCLDKPKRFKLSREAKNKADKKRSKVAENDWRSIHAAMPMLRRRLRTTRFRN